MNHFPRPFWGGSPVPWQPSRIQGSAPVPPGDPPGPSSQEVKMAHIRDGLIAGAAAFLIAKYGLESETTASLLVGAGVGGATYMLLQNTKHQETRYY